MHRFRFDSIIGEGAFATVFRCHRLEDGKAVAVKRLQTRYSDFNSAYSLMEIQALLAVRGQPNIIQMEEMGREADGTVFYSMELFNASLLDLLKQQKHLDEKTTRSLLRQLMTGIGVLHAAGFVHRDLKPENILVSCGLNSRPEKGENVQVVLADLGSSVRFSSEPRTDYVTTRFYRSPEMVLKDPFYGPKVDVWASGCVAFEVLAGRPLFPAQGEGDLLLRMCSTLGSPPFEDERFRRMVNINFNQIPTQFPKQAIRRWFMGSELAMPSPDCVSLLEKLICWIPDDRLDCATVLRTEPFLKQF